MRSRAYLKRGVVIGVPVVLTGLLVLLHVRTAAPSVNVEQETIVVTSASRENVRVEHEWVHVPAPSLAATAAAARPPARATRVTRRATREPTMLAKARRLIVGNGRYRPRPFPRVHKP